MSIFEDAICEWLKTKDIKCRSALVLGNPQRDPQQLTNSWNVTRTKLLYLKQLTRSDVFEQIDINYEYPQTVRKQYESVFAINVMQYVWDPMQAFRNISLLTADGGELYATFPLVNPIQKPTHCDMLRYTRFAIEKYAEATGFHIRELKPVHSEGDLLQKAYSRNKLRVNREYLKNNEIGYLLKAIKL